MLREAHAGHALLLGALLGACSPGQLYVASDTVLGLSAHVNTAQTSGSLSFGYDRKFATVVPRSVDQPSGTPASGLGTSETGREVMAVLDCSEVTVSGPFLSGFVEHLATGRAARNFAGGLRPAGAGVAQPSETALSGFFSCFKDER